MKSKIFGLVKVDQKNGKKLREKERGCGGSEGPRATKIRPKVEKILTNSTMKLQIKN
jgi:hypothetical protein